MPMTMNAALTVIFGTRGIICMFIGINTVRLSEDSRVT
jgi:hypothetical protein